MITRVANLETDLTHVIIRELGYPRVEGNPGMPYNASHLINDRLDLQLSLRR